MSPTLVWGGEVPKPAEVSTVRADFGPVHLRCAELCAGRGDPDPLSQRKRMASVAAARGDHRRACQLSAGAADMADKAAREKSDARMVELAEHYEFERKQRQIDELNHRHERQTAELQKRTLQQRWLRTVLGSSLILLAGTAYFFLRLRRTNRMLEVLNTQVSRSQNKLQATLDAIPDLLFVLGLDGRYYEYHSPRTDLLAAPAEVLLGKTVSDIMPPDAADVCMSALREAHEKGVSSGKQFELSLPHGKFWFELSVSRKSMGQGGEPRFIVLSRDITERKRMEDALVASRKMLTEAQRLAQVGSWELDMESNTLSWSDELFRIFEIDPQQFGATYEAFLNVIHPDDREAVNRAYAESLETHAYYDIEHRLLMPDGRIKFVYERCETHYSPEGKPQRSLGIARDITERKHMEEELLYRENKFRTLAENSPNIIIRYDRNCRCIYVNPAYAKEIGISVEDAINRVPDSQWSADISITVQAMAIMETGIPAEIYLEWPRPDTGQITSHIFHVVAERGPDGRVLGTLAIGHNITALKEAEKHLEASHAQLRGLAARLETVREEERKRIARDMHDELGQYLTALRMGVSVLRMQSGENDPAILEQVRGLSTLADKTIQVVRDIAASLRPAPLDMGVVSALEWLAEDFSRRTGVPCKLDTEGEEIRLDDKHSTAIFRMVQESLTNVARHAEASQVEIRLNRQGDDYLLEVSDNGKGFDVSLPRTKSFGLVGLRERAIMLGGEVFISSAANRGTAVRARIPIHEAER